MAVEFKSEPPASISSRVYVKYAELQQEFKDNLGQWGKMWSLPVGENGADIKTARGKAQNYLAMIRNGTGSWKGAKWEAVASQPVVNGDLEVWVRCTEILPVVEKPAEVVKSAVADETTDVPDSSADEASVTDESATEVATDTPVRRRRGAAVSA